MKQANLFVLLYRVESIVISNLINQWIYNRHVLIFSFACS